MEVQLFIVLLISGLGLGGSILASIVIVQQYFDKKRAFAAGVSLMGGSVGGMVSPPLIRLAIDSLGWRGAMMLHGGICLHITLFGALMFPIPQQRQTNSLPSKTVQDNTQCKEMATIRCNDQHSNNNNSERHKNHQTSNSCLRNIAVMFEPSLLKQWDFIIYIMGSILLNFGIAVMYQHSPSRAVYYGIDRLHASVIPSGIAMGSTFARVLASVLGNMKCTIRPLYYAIVVGAGGVVCCASCLLSSVFIGTMVTAGLYGIFLGQMLTLMPTVMVDIVGISGASMAQGWLQTASFIATVSAVPFAGKYI